ncbi:MAG: hypothetical protein LBJ63_10540 [Prevotellaceae bacterium]|jgi:hypothetical protein|nr:hypothetical protein [Prevotellaceae bacterium]
MTKKFLVIAVAILSVGFTTICKAQNIERLPQITDDYEIYPKQVATIFVMSIINKDYVKMESQMTSQFKNELRKILRENNLTMDKLFTEENCHDIVGMRPVVKMGYNIVITNAYRNEKGEFSVSFNCVDNNNNFYNGDHDTTTRVVLIWQDDRWLVSYFK